jgi:hypothetical protein
LSSERETVNLKLAHRKAQRNSHASRKKTHLRGTHQRVRLRLHMCPRLQLCMVPRA